MATKCPERPKRSRRRNSRSPIHRLPPELLIHIFSYLICAEYPSDSPSSSTVVASTHVCRHWRAVALDTPALWTNLVGDDIPKAEAFIQRSGRALMDVTLTVGATSPADYLKTVVLHDRLRSLTVEAPFNSVGWLQDAVVEIARTDAPCLTTLHLLDLSNCGTNEYLRHGPRSVHTYGLREDFSEESPTPALRSLRLRPSFLSWHSNIYKNLHVLDVTAYQFRLNPVSEQRMLDILRQCPELLQLRLCLGADLASPAASPTRRNETIALPLLSIVSLEEFTPRCVASLLSHLILPSSTQYNFSLDVLGHYESPYFPQAFPDDLSRLPGLAEIRTVWVEMNLGITVRLYRSGVDPGEPTANFVLSDGDGCYILALPDGILESAEKFIFSTPRDEDGFIILQWPELFSRAPRLRTVRLVRPDSDDLTEAMGALAESVIPESPLPCPELECLELTGMCFDGYDQESVVDALRIRGRAGFPLQRLVLEEIEGELEEWVSRLRDLGVDVVRRVSPRPYIPRSSVIMDSDSSETSSPTSDSPGTSTSTSGASSQSQSDDEA